MGGTRWRGSCNTVVEGPLDIDDVSGAKRTEIRLAHSRNNSLSY